MQYYLFQHVRYETWSGTLHKLAICLDQQDLSRRIDKSLIHLLDIGDNRTLFLAGHYLHEPCEAGRFPSTRIRVYWHSELEFTYGVQNLGDILIPSMALPPLRSDVVDLSFNPKDRDIVAQDLDSVCRLVDPESAQLS